MALLLVFAAFFQLSDATQASASCAIRAYKVTRPPMLIHLAAFWGLSLPLGEDSLLAVRALSMA